MTIIMLIRHGETDDIGNALAGQINTHLNSNGVKQSKILAQNLSKLPIEAIFSSPLKRPQQTAAPLAAALNLPVRILQCINQVNFGDWQGMSFESLDIDERWYEFQKNPVLVDVPGGENAIQVKKRVTDCYTNLSRTFSENSLIATFTHGSIIRHCVCSFLGIDLQNFNNIKISAASVTTIKITTQSSKLLHLNQGIPLDFL